MTTTPVALSNQIMGANNRDPDHPFDMGVITAYNTTTGLSSVTVNDSAIATTNVVSLRDTALNVGDKVLLLRFGNSWIIVGPVGGPAAWPTWTPVWYYGVTVATFTNVEAAVNKDGRKVHATLSGILSNFNAGTGLFSFTLPYLPKAYAAGRKTFNRPIGSIRQIQSSNVKYPAEILYDLATGHGFACDYATTPADWLNTNFAVGSEVDIRLDYESAT